MCHHKLLAEQWVRGIFDAILFCNEAEKNKTLKDSMSKKMKILDDLRGKVINLTEEPEVKPVLEEESSVRHPYMRKESIFKRNTSSINDNLKPPEMTASGLGSSQLGDSNSNSKSFQEDKEKPHKPTCNSNTST